MKVKHLLALTIISAGLATLIAHASTPQEDIARYTDYIKQNSAHIDMIKIDYAERAIAYAKVGQWENCLRDNAWLKSNSRIYTWSSHRGLSEARTKAYLGLGRTDEAVKDMYETFLAGAHSSDLRRLQDFIAKNPQYANYLDLNARASMIQQYATPEYAEKMWTSADSSGVRESENGWYMLKVAEKMAENMPKSQKRDFYDIYSRIGYNRYSTCKLHPEDPAYNTSDTARETFIKNGSIACSEVMSCDGIAELYRLEKTFGEICMDAFDYMRKDTKSKLATYEKLLGTCGNTPACSSERSSFGSVSSTNYNTNSNSSSVETNYNPSYNTNSSSAQTNNNSNPLGNAINTFDNGIKQTDTMIKNINSIKSGLKNLGF